MIKVFFALFIIMFAHTDVFGQGGRFASPEDSIQCIRNYAMYSDRYRANNFEDAYPLWKEVYNTCPEFHLNLYIHGNVIFRHMIENAGSEEEKSALLEEAMEMFDNRIEYFGDEANVLVMKGSFWFRFNPNPHEAETGYEALKSALDMTEDNPSPVAVLLYMNVTVGKFHAGLVDNEYVIETYSYLVDITDNAIENNTNNQLAQVREGVEDLFKGSGAADCDALIRIYGERIENAPGDVDLLQDVYEMLSGARCTDSDLFLDITEKLHDHDPDAGTAMNLAAMYRARNDMDNVEKYLLQAIELEDNPTERANYYLELAFITNQVRNNRQLSRQYARQALEDNPNLGRAHMHIGSLYASETNCFAGDEEAAFKNLTVFWVAVDRFNEAKRVDPSLAAEANRMIETYSVYFPDMESIFFHGYSEGQSYTVGCWINETTRIRARKQ